MKAELIEEYLLVDAEDRGRLRAELGQLALPFTETPLFKIDLNGHNIHQILKSIDTPLSVIKTHTPTLEDAYLAVVENS